MSTTTATQNETPMRRRLRVLERTQSDLSNSGLPDIKIIPLKHKHDNGSDEHATSSPTNSESHTESTDDDEENVDIAELPGDRERHHGSHRVERPTVRPTVSVDMANTRRHSSRKERSPMSPTTRAWYEFDLAVVVALVSPIGNWLTGGDHIKNLLLIVLLIFYLHQIIEVPWSLYQKSRPRHRPLQMPQIDPDTPEGRYAQLAASELSKLELFFLVLTFMSPILGAVLLRYGTSIVLGDDAVSWFSTGLFVLATGVRPWAHLVDRLSQRTLELHDFVHYPSPTHGISQEQHGHLEARIAQLEASLTKVKAKLTHTTEDVYEYVDDAVDAVEHAMRKQQRIWTKYEGKVKEVEQAMGRLQSVRTTSVPLDIGAAKAYLQSIFNYIVPSWIIRPRSFLPPSPTVKMHMRPLSGTSSSSSSTPLETILEEEDGTETEKYPTLAQPYRLTSGMIYRAGYLATLPLRAVARMVLRNY